MSENVLSFGYMALLTVPRDYEESEELLYEHGIGLNYEGTIVYTDIGTDDYAAILTEQDKEMFLAELDLLGLGHSDLVPYCAYWYNGADSFMSDLTAEEFKIMKNR